MSIDTKRFTALCIPKKESAFTKAFLDVKELLVDRV